MSFKVSYWSSWLLPEMEGISKEVWELARYFNSPVFGFNENLTIRFDLKKKLFGINTKYYLLFKLLAPIIEMRYSITHIYDNLANWFYLKNLGKRPIILTATVGEEPLELSFYKKVRKIVVDSKLRFNKLKKIFPKEKLELIYPGVDINFFTPSESSDKNIKKFKILFASSPSTVEEMKDRGIYRILDCASMLPNTIFTLLWRPWGDTLPVIKEEISRRDLKNVILYTKVIEDIREILREHHIIIAPFSKGGGKPCPTSVIEALSCGLPAVVGVGVEIGDLLEEKGVGIRVDDNPVNIVKSIESIKRNWFDMSNMARKVAEEFFNQQKTFMSYRQLYSEVLKV